jgi:hypothetical protein
MVLIRSGRRQGLSSGVIERRMLPKGVGIRRTNFFGKKNSFSATRFQRSWDVGRNVGPPQFVLPEAL